jgi:hypothetical protein
MKPLHTVYDLQNVKLIPGYSVFLLLPFVIGLAMFFYNMFNRGSETINSLGFNKRKFNMYLGLVLSLFFLSVFGGIYSYQLGIYNTAKDIFNKKEYKIAEGIVKNYHPMPAAGHDTERFDVDGVHFEFSDYVISGIGYNTSASHGGAIKADLYVQLFYITDDGNNEIIKLRTE